MMIRKIKLIFIVLVSVFLVIFASFFLIGYFFPKKAGLLVISNPKAEVFVDGNLVGETPYDVALDPKEVSVRILPFDSKLVPYETKLKLVSGVKTVLQRDLAENDSKSSGIVISFERVVGKKPIVLVASEPDGAQVFLDDNLIGVTPIELDSVETGEHKLSVSYPDHLAKEVNIRTYPGHKLTAFLKLAPVLDDSISEKMSLNFKIRIFQVGKEGFGVREGPDLFSRKVGVIKEGEEYIVLEESEDHEWFKISKEGGEWGWIPSKYAQRVD
jgi:hypothetical protein